MARLAAIAAFGLAVVSSALGQDTPTYLDDRSTPEAVISSFYNAIGRHEYARAWSYYQDGVGVPAYDDFVKGYAGTSTVSVSFGQAAQEGAAGSTYYTLPVVLDATGSNATHQYFAGCYTLRLVQPALQEQPPYRPLHIVEGTLKAVASPGFAPADCTP